MGEKWGALVTLSAIKTTEQNNAKPSREKRRSRVGRTYGILGLATGSLDLYPASACPSALYEI